MSTKKARPLTPKQVELLCVLLPRNLMPDHAAFQMNDAPVSAAQRVMNTLSARGLAFEDEPVDAYSKYRYSWRISPKGEQWVRENRAIVEKVHLDLGFTKEDVDSIYTKQLG